MAERTHKLSLLDNSHSFLKEAVNKAVLAREDVSQWKFAILNLVQAVELSMKELLRREHPTLIYENIDNPRNTVSISQALARIENDKILGITIPEKEKRKILAAAKLRNEITHYEFEFVEEAAMAKFSEIFAFIVYFQTRHLQIEIDEIIDHDLMQKVVEIEKCFSELEDKAIQRIKDEGISDENIMRCIDCGAQTFVIKDSQNICYLCRGKDQVVKCPYCGEYDYELNMENLLSIFDAEFSNGEWTIHNDFGYSHDSCCPGCFFKIKSDIESKRAEEYYEKLERECGN